MYHKFKDKGLLFQETTLAMSLADGQQAIGTDFLSYAGLVLDVKNTCWHFWDNPTHMYPFGEELDTPSLAEKMSKHHTSAVTPYNDRVKPLNPLRKSGRPPKVPQTPASSSGRRRNQMRGCNKW
ncbi:hypothetical protein TNCV_4919741 [Trichonephila clavipes]|nr:hypothetical protein TNCV_4919741 [Trichonephila clavipes]